MDILQPANAQPASAASTQRNLPPTAMASPRMPVLRHSRQPAQLDLFGSSANQRQSEPLAQPYI